MKKPSIAPPKWLVDAQRDFGRLLRTPLLPAQKNFEVATLSNHTSLAQLLGPQPHGHQARPLPLHERLEVYQKQYWMRLFSTLQETHPYTSAVASPWHFNKLASLYYQEHPPKDPDLGRCGLLFLKTLRLHLWKLLHQPSASRSSPPSLQSLVRARPQNTTMAALSSSGTPPAPWKNALCALPCALSALHQAIELDKALQKTFHARALEPWKPTGDEAQNLKTRPLRWSAHTTVVREHRAMAHLSHQELAAQDGPLQAPVHASPQFWVFSRAQDGPCRVQISPVQALMLTQGRTMSIQAVLQRLQRSTKPELHARWQAEVPAWIEKGLKLHWWSGSTTQ